MGLIYLFYQPTRCNNNSLLIIPISLTCFGQLFCPYSEALDCVYSLWCNAPTMLPAGRLEAEELRFQVYWPALQWVHYTTSCNTQSSASEDGRNHRPRHVELIGIINKPLFLHLVGCLLLYR